MTTQTSPIAGLEVRSVDSTGRTYYEATVRRPYGISTIPGHDTEYQLDGLSGFWQLDAQTIAALLNGKLVLNAWYKLALTTKPKPPGPRTNPGSMYQDIKKAVLAEPEEIPAQEPASNSNAPQTGSQDDYRRSKQEMRWTEAYHMATRIVPPRGLKIVDRVLGDEQPEQDAAMMEAFISGWASWFYNELASVGNTEHEAPTEPGEPEMPPPADEPEDNLPF